MRKNLIVITQPSWEPVTLDEAKLWLRVDDDDTDEDATILLLSKAMREYAEHLTGRALAEQTLELRLDAFPVGVIELPRPPLRSVTSISYVDSDGALQALDASPAGWQEDSVSEPGRVSPHVGSSWPDARGDELGAVRIRYVAGYANPNSVPRLVRLWMQARLATLFENREQIISGTIVAPLPRDFVDGLLDSLVVRTRFA